MIALFVIRVSFQSLLCLLRFLSSTLVYHTSPCFLETLSLLGVPFPPFSRPVPLPHPFLFSPYPFRPFLVRSLCPTHFSFRPTLFLLHLCLAVFALSLCVSSPSVFPRPVLLRFLLSLILLVFHTYPLLFCVHFSFAVISLPSPSFFLSFVLSCLSRFLTALPFPPCLKKQQARTSFPSTPSALSSSFPASPLLPPTSEAADPKRGQAHAIAAETQGAGKGAPGRH